MSLFKTFTDEVETSVNVFAVSMKYRVLHQCNHNLLSTLIVPGFSSLPVTSLNKFLSHSALHDSAVDTINSDSQEDSVI